MGDQNPLSISEQAHQQMLDSLKQDEIRLSANAKMGEGGSVGLSANHTEQVGKFNVTFRAYVKAMFKGQKTGATVAPEAGFDVALTKR